MSSPATAPSTRDAWDLSRLRENDGAQYLLDKATGWVFEDTANELEPLTLLGHLVNGRVQLWDHTSWSYFSLLKGHTKVHHDHLPRVFSRYLRRSRRYGPKLSI